MPKWQSTVLRASKKDCVLLHPEATSQLKMAHALLHLLPKLDGPRWLRALQMLRSTDQVEGPRACAWLLNTMARRVPDGRFLRAEADILMEECCTMRRIRKGWRQLGDDPWLIVHPPKDPWLPRYNSEPSIRTLAAR